MSYNVYRDGVFYGWHSDKLDAMRQASDLAPQAATGVTVEKVILVYRPDGSITGELET